MRSKAGRAVRRRYIRSGDATAIRALSMCRGLSCEDAPSVVWMCRSGLMVGGENRKPYIASRARRIASVRRDAYEGRPVLEDARTPLREQYAATSDGDDGSWDERKRDQSICARSAYMRLGCWPKWVYRYDSCPSSTRDRVGLWLGSFCSFSLEEEHPRSTLSETRR